MFKFSDLLYRNKDWEKADEEETEQMDCNYFDGGYAALAGVLWSICVWDGYDRSRD